jgi:hypothetical protein
MAPLANAALTWALLVPSVQAARLRRSDAEAHHESAEAGMEVASIPVTMYRKDCWKRQKRRYALLEETYPGAGMNQSGPFEEVLKDGYYPVDCLKDYMHEFADKYGNNKFKYNQANVSGVSIVHYREVMGRGFREKITHDVCFRFCRTIPEMYFFGIKNGNDCYCAPYYRAMAGDSDTCDSVCEGDSTQICGSATKSNIFEMHLCAKTGKELSDATEKMGETKENLETLSAKAMEVANEMQFAAAGLQKFFSQRDYESSDQMQQVKVFAGDLINAAKQASKVMDGMDELKTEAKKKDGADFKVGKEINEAEELTAKIQKSISAGTASSEEIEYLLDEASPGQQYNETTPSEQYRPVMYFVDKAYYNETASTCAGETVGKPKVGTIDTCAEACDFEVGDCVGFNYMSNTTDVGLCILFSKLKSAVYYEGCKEAKPSGDYKGDPMQTQCMAKLADFEGTTLKPDPSGKCPMCLKKADMARKCYTEYAK